MHKLKRNILVTGVSSGIGHSIATKLIAEGHTIIGISRRASKADLDSDRYYGFDIDLSRLDVLESHLQKLTAKHPGIDAAVLCAGIGQFGSLEEFSYNQIRSMIDLNFTSQAFIAKAIVATLKRKKKGDMIFMGSEAALKGSRKGTIYCASKFALRGFTQALREECAKSNVRVTLINPGMVKTHFFDSLGFTHGDANTDAIEPEDIAQLVSELLKTRQGTIIDEINLSPANKVIKFTST